MTAARAAARTTTKPLTRPTMHNPDSPGPTSPCAHVKIWAYRHSKLTHQDLAGVARAFGIPPAALVETALRTTRSSSPS